MKRVMYTQMKYFESGTRDLKVKLKKERKRFLRAGFEPHEYEFLGKPNQKSYVYSNKIL